MSTPTERQLEQHTGLLLSSRNLTNLAIQSELKLGSIEIASPGGLIVDLLKLKPSDINFRMIARTLSRKGRFNDNSDYPTNVAAHSLLVYHLMSLDYYNDKLDDWFDKAGLTKDAQTYRQLSLACLMHDGGEVFVGDVVTGIKRSIFGANIEPLEEHVYHVIMESLVCPLGLRKDVRAFVKKYDLIALSIEVPIAFDYVDPRWYDDGWIARPETIDNLESGANYFQKVLKEGLSGEILFNEVMRHY